MTDAEHDHVMAFAEEFAHLVRKYMPQSPTTPAQSVVLAFMQDHTSCYAPYVWDNKFKPKEST